MSIPSSLPPLLRSAFKTFEKVLAVEAFELYNKHKDSANVRATIKVEKLFYTVHLSPKDPSGSESLKTEAIRLARKLSYRPELQDPFWETRHLVLTTIFWFDPGVGLYLTDKNGKKCAIRTTRLAEHIAYDTEEGTDWHHHPSKPEPWMK